MEVKELKKEPTFTAPDLAIIQEWVSPNNSRAERISMASIEIPAGVRILKHYHKETEEVYFISEGSGVMELGDERRKVSSGDAIVILPGEVHCIENPGEKPLKMLVTCVPHWQEDDQYFV